MPHSLLRHIDRPDFKPACLQIAALWVSPTSEHLVVAWKGHITIWHNAVPDERRLPFNSDSPSSSWAKIIEWERPDVDSRFRGQHFLSGAESDYAWGNDLRCVCVCVTQVAPEHHNGANFFSLQCPLSALSVLSAA